MDKRMICLRKRSYKILSLIGRASTDKLEAIENKGGPLSDYASEELYKRYSDDYKRCIGEL